MPLLLSRYDLALWNEQWDKFVALSTTASGRYTRGGSRHNLEEIAAIHNLKARRVLAATREATTMSVMARRAILRGMLLAMASETRAHCVGHCALGNGRLRKISVTD